MSLCLKLGYLLRSNTEVFFVSDMIDYIIGENNMSKVAVVTGASKGIGAATAIAFGKAGYDVVVNYKSDSKAAEKVVKQIEEFGQKALAVQAHVFTEDGIKGH
jgi:NAD(P)-dependent dehydrogenase (short-subunit alcohol dehydrogenase family)